MINPAFSQLDDAVIRRQTPDDIDEVVALSLRAWQPVFESTARVLGPRINRLVYPDWAAGQARAVEATCRDEKTAVWVAELDGRAVGFAAVVFHQDRASGEIDMVAVDPDRQGRGTGGDPGNAAARRTYEKAGFSALPLVRYYKEL